VTHCGICDDTEGTCTGCLDGYGLIGANCNTACSTVSQCATCDTTETICTACLIEFIINSNVCDACPAGCNWCISAT